jgi:hypothetical protein
MTQCSIALTSPDNPNCIYLLRNPHLAANLQNYFDESKNLIPSSPSMLRSLTYYQLTFAPL